MYEVGDKVRIRECPPEHPQDVWVHWLSGMDEYCGQVAIIEETGENENGQYYFLDIDFRNYVWCDECFAASLELDPEPETSEEDLFALIGM